MWLLRFGDPAYNNLAAPDPDGNGTPNPLEVLNVDDDQAGNPLRAQLFELHSSCGPPDQTDVHARKVDGLDFRIVSER